MQFTILATVLGFAATGFGYGNVTVTLCNDFHGGKPCELHNVVPQTCSKLSFPSFFFFPFCQYLSNQTPEKEKRPVPNH